MTSHQQDELKAIYHKVMIGAITLLVAILGYFGSTLIGEIETMNAKLDTIIEQVIRNQIEIEHLKKGH